MLEEKLTDSDSTTQQNGENPGFWHRATNFWHHATNVEDQKTSERTSLHPNHSQHRETRDTPRNYGATAPSSEAKQTEKYIISIETKSNDESSSRCEIPRYGTLGASIISFIIWMTSLGVIPAITKNSNWTFTASPIIALLTFGFLSLNNIEDIEDHIRGCRTASPKTILASLLFSLIPGILFSLVISEITEEALGTKKTAEIGINGALATLLMFYCLVSNHEKINDDCLREWSGDPSPEQARRVALRMEEIRIAREISRQRTQWTFQR